MYYIILDEDKSIYGMYDDDGEFIDEHNTVLVDEELFKYVYELPGRKIFAGEISDSTLTIEDKDLFKADEVVIIKEKTEVELLQDEVTLLTEQNMMQDELINVTMMATDEVFTLLEPLLNPSPEPLSINSTFRRTRKEVKQPMVDLYVAMVIRGLKDIEDVPARYREQVKEILAALEK